MEGEPSKSDSRPAEEFLPLVYEQLRGLAAKYLDRERGGHTLQPTALVHEAWIRVSDQTGVRFQNSSHLLALSAQAMRRILVDHARRRQAEKRGGAAQRVTFSEELTPSPDDPLDLVALDGALTRLGVLSERQARVVELRFFGGLSVEQVADVMAISESTVAADWRAARAWLQLELQKR